MPWADALVWLAVLAAAGCLSGCERPAADGVESTTWSLVPELRIGSLDDTRYAFGQIIDVTVGPAGRVYVTQWQVPSVFVYDRRGEFVGRFGRGGSGPGEFSSAGRMGWRGDSLWIADLAGKIHLYETNGRFVRTVQSVVPDPDGNGVLRPSALLSDGSVLAQPAISDYAVLVEGLRRVGLRRVSSEGEIVGTIGWRDLRRHWHEIRYREEGGIHAIGPFMGSTLWAVRPDGSGVLLVDPESPAGPSSYRLVEVSAAGDTVLDVSREVPPEPITDAFVETLVSSRYSEDDYIQGELTFARYRDAFIAGLERPENHPPVTEVLVGEDGTTWIRREDLRETSVRWEALYETGRQLATVHVPSGVTVKTVTGDALWGVETDALDVPYLVRYRIDKR